MDEARKGKSQKEKDGSYGLPAVRRAAAELLKGRMLTGAVGVVYTIFLARALSVPSYAAYAVFLGLMGLLSVLAAFGADDVAQRFVPEARMREDHWELRRLVRRLILTRLAALLLITAALAAAAPAMAGWLSIPDRVWELRLWLGVTLFTILFRMCNSLLGALLQQQTIKWLNMLVYTSRAVGVMAWSFLAPLKLAHVAMVEGVAMATGLALAAVALARALPPAEAAGADEDARLRTRIKHGRYAFFAYLRQIADLLGGQAANRLAVGGLTSVSSIASYGFAQSMASIPERYTPGSLLRNVARPALMGHFSRDGDYALLGRKAHLVFKLNCLMFAPVLMWMALFGNWLTALLSRGRYPEAGWILVALVALDVVNHHYQVLEVHANAAEKNQLLLYASLVPPLFLIPALGLLMSVGVIGFILARFAGVVVRDGCLAYLLRRHGVRYEWPWSDFAKLIVCTLAPALVFFPLTRHAASYASVAALGAGSGLLFAGLLLWLQPWSDWDRGTLNRLLGRKVFRV